MATQNESRHESVPAALSFETNYLKSKYHFDEAEPELPEAILHVKKYLAVPRWKACCEAAWKAVDWKELFRLEVRGEAVALGLKIGKIILPLALMYLSR